MTKGIWILAPLALLLLAAACDGDGSPESSDGTAETPAPSRRAFIPEDTTEFLGRFIGIELGAEKCEYDIGTGEIDCTEPGYGIILVEPPVPDEGAKCELMLADLEPVGVVCTTPGSAAPIFYEIGP